MAHGADIRAAAESPWRSLAQAFDVQSQGHSGEDERAARGNGTFHFDSGGVLLAPLVQSDRSVLGREGAERREAIVRLSSLVPAVCIGPARVDSMKLGAATKRQAIRGQGCGPDSSCCPTLPCYGARGAGSCSLAPPLTSAFALPVPVAPRRRLNVAQNLTGPPADFQANALHVVCRRGPSSTLALC